ncbi:MAG: YheU family protein [Pseudomonadales bacterium]
MAMVKIPMNSLSMEALRGIVEGFVLREGTDYGHRDFSLQQKCAAVERQLDAGQAEIWFDLETGTAEIRPVG